MGTFQFLGTGASAGVPVIGCDCSVCKSTDPLNHRLRPSGLIRIQDKVVVIDVGPDFRFQALKYKIHTLDGVLLTHTHYDHIAGIDEIRAFNIQKKKNIPVLLSQSSLDDLKKRYYYLFQEKERQGSFAAQIEPQILPQDIGSVEFLDLSVQYVSYFQANMNITGYRIGNFAYITDIRKYEHSIFDFLEGVDTLVLSALKEEPSYVHFSFEEAVAFARKVKCKKTWLTHLSHASDHQTACKKLPPDVQLGFDGQEISFYA